MNTLLSNTAAAAFMLCTVVLNAQVSEPGFEYSNSGSTWAQCSNIGCSNCSGDPWQGYSDVAAPASSFFRTPQPGSGTGGGNYLPSSNYHPAPEDDIPGNTRYMVVQLHSLAAASNNGTLTMGVVNPLVAAVDPGCEYQIALRWTAKARYGPSTPLPNTMVTIKAILGTDLHLNCSTLDHAAGLTIASVTDTITFMEANEIGNWFTLSGTATPDQAFNSIALEVTVTGFNTNSGYDVYLDDVQLAKVDENCVLECCNANCPADLNCDGLVGIADLTTFNSYWGTLTADIDNPCHQLIDINNDGVIGVTDRLYIIGQYGTTCSNNLSNAPTTARTLDDRIGHVLTATAEPNPGVGQYRIAHQLPGEGAIDITVVDHQGRVVVRRSVADQPTLLLDLQDQQPGTYTAVLVRNENLSTVRLVKE